LIDRHLLIPAVNLQVSSLPQGRLQLARPPQQAYPTCYAPEMRPGNPQLSATVKLILKLVGLVFMRLRKKHTLAAHYNTFGIRVDIGVRLTKT
jgi:hypothetical protein